MLGTPADLVPDLLEPLDRAYRLFRMRHVVAVPDHGCPVVSLVAHDVVDFVSRDHCSTEIANAVGRI